METEGYIMHCVEFGRELQEFEGDICESCWAMDYEFDDDDSEYYDNAYEYFGYNYF